MKSSRKKNRTFKRRKTGSSGSAYRAVYGKGASSYGKRTPSHGKRTSSHGKDASIRGEGNPLVRRNVKDRLFRYIFEQDREALLELYNALNGTDYRNKDALKMMTVENVIYLSMKNDLAFTIAGVLNLYEQQSTVNPNMPVRFLIYLGEEYQRIIGEYGEEKIYGTKLLKLPAPHCVVFYNGNREEPEEQFLRLSDAYEHPEEKPDVELEVRMLNINYGRNQELMDKCRKLKEYSYFIGRVNEGLRQGTGIRDAADRAIDICLREGILKDILTNSRMEVLGMLLSEYDEKKVRENWWQEGRESGLEEGRLEGIRILIAGCRSTGATYEQTLQQVMELYKLRKDEAEEYLCQQWK